MNFQPTGLHVLSSVPRTLHNWSTVFFPMYRGTLELKNHASILRKNGSFSYKPCGSLTALFVKTKIYFCRCKCGNKQINKNCWYRFFVQTVEIGVKVGPGARDPEPQDPGTWDSPQSLKVGPGTALKFKSGTPSPFFNEFTFSRMFHLIFTYLFFFVSFLNQILKISSVSNRSQQSAPKIKRYI